MASRAMYLAIRKATDAPTVAETNAKAPPTTDPKVMPATMVMAEAGNIKTAATMYKST